MMMQMNFLTKEYKMKLLVSGLVKVSLVIVVIVLLVEFAVGTAIQLQVDAVRRKIVATEEEIKTTNDEIATIKEKQKAIPDLTDKIKMIDDLFLSENQKFSEMLYRIEESTPKKVWYGNLKYSKNAIVLKGEATGVRNPNEKSSTAEINIFKLERQLKDVEMFSGVNAEYIKTSNARGNVVKSFEYRIDIIQGEVETENNKAGDN